MHERRAGMRPVEHAITLVLYQDSLQSARQPSCLTVAEHDDGGAIRDLLGK